MSNALFWSTLGIASLLAYLPALRSFFSKDDLILILSAQTNLSNLFIHSWPGGFFRPTAELLFAFQNDLFGLSPLPYHLLSFGIHSIATVVLYRLFLYLVNDRQQSRIASIIFALHPLHTESVSWISGQMSLFAGLSSLLLFSLLQNKHSRFIRFVMPTLLTAISLGFYENFIISLLLWVALYCYIPRSRRQQIPSHFAIAALLSAIPTAVYLYWRFAILGLRGGNYSVQFSPESALINLLAYLYFLLGGTSIGGRIIYYQPGQIFTDKYFLYVFPPLFILSAILLLTATALYLYNRTANKNISPTAALSIAWLCIALIPAIILPERPRRLAYISVPAFSLFMGICFSYILQKTRRRLIFAQAGLLLYFAVLSTTLYARNTDWKVASNIEKNMPTLLLSTRHCSSIIVDAPNLLGDALFFNSLSTARWIKLTTATNIPVYDIHQLPPQHTLPTPTCLYRYDSGQIVYAEDTNTSPRFTRGKNWVLPPRP